MEYLLGALFVTRCFEPALVADGDDARELASRQVQLRAQLSDPLDGADGSWTSRELADPGVLQPPMLPTREGRTATVVPPLGSSEGAPTESPTSSVGSTVSVPDLRLALDSLREGSPSSGRDLASPLSPGQHRSDSTARRTHAATNPLPGTTEDGSCGGGGGSTPTTTTTASNTAAAGPVGSARAQLSPSPAAVPYPHVGKRLRTQRPRGLQPVPFAESSRSTAILFSPEAPSDITAPSMASGGGAAAAVLGSQQQHQGPQGPPPVALEYRVSAQQLLGKYVLVYVPPPRTAADIAVEFGSQPPQSSSLFFPPGGGGRQRASPPSRRGTADVNYSGVGSVPRSRSFSSIASPRLGTPDAESLRLTGGGGGGDSLSAVAASAGTVGAHGPAEPRYAATPSQQRVLAFYCLLLQQLKEECDHRLHSEQKNQQRRGWDREDARAAAAAGSTGRSGDLSSDTSDGINDDGVAADATMTSVALGDSGSALWRLHPRRNLVEAPIAVLEVRYSGPGECMAPMSASTYSSSHGGGTAVASGGAAGVGGGCGGPGAAGLGPLSLPYGSSGPLTRSASASAVSTQGSLARIGSWVGTSADDVAAHTSQYHHRMLWPLYAHPPSGACSHTEGPPVLTPLTAPPSGLLPVSTALPLLAQGSLDETPLSERIVFDSSILNNPFYGGWMRVESVDTYRRIVQQCAVDHWPAVVLFDPAGNVLTAMGLEHVEEELDQYLAHLGAAPSPLSTAAAMGLRGGVDGGDQRDVSATSSAAGTLNATLRTMLSRHSESPAASGGTGPELTSDPVTAAAATLGAPFGAPPTSEGAFHSGHSSPSPSVPRARVSGRPLHGLTDSGPLPTAATANHGTMSTSTPTTAGRQVNLPLDTGCTLRSHLNVPTQGSPRAVNGSGISSATPARLAEAQDTAVAPTNVTTATTTINEGEAGEDSCSRREQSVRTELQRETSSMSMNDPQVPTAGPTPVKGVPGGCGVAAAEGTTSGAIDDVPATARYRDPATLTHAPLCLPVDDDTPPGGDAVATTAVDGETVAGTCAGTSSHRLPLWTFSTKCDRRRRGDMGDRREPASPTGTRVASEVADVVGSSTSGNDAAKGGVSAVFATARALAMVAESTPAQLSASSAARAATGGFASRFPWNCIIATAEMLAAEPRKSPTVTAPPGAASGGAATTTGVSTSAATITAMKTAVGSASLAEVESRALTATHGRVSRATAPLAGGAPSQKLHPLGSLASLAVRVSDILGVALGTGGGGGGGGEIKELNAHASSRRMSLRRVGGSPSPHRPDGAADLCGEDGAAVSDTTWQQHASVKFGSSTTHLVLFFGAGWHPGMSGTVAALRRLVSSVNGRHRRLVEMLQAARARRKRATVGAVKPSRSGDDEADGATAGGGGDCGAPGEKELHSSHLDTLDRKFTALIGGGGGVPDNDHDRERSTPHGDDAGAEVSASGLGGKGSSARRSRSSSVSGDGGLGGFPFRFSGDLRNLNMGGGLGGIYGDGDGGNFGGSNGDSDDGFGDGSGSESSEDEGRHCSVQVVYMSFDEDLSSLQRTLHRMPADWLCLTALQLPAGVERGRSKALPRELVLELTRSVHNVDTFPRLVVLELPLAARTVAAIQRCQRQPPPPCKGSIVSSSGERRDGNDVGEEDLSDVVENALRTDMPFDDSVFEAYWSVPQDHAECHLSSDPTGKHFPWPSTSGQISNDSEGAEASSLPADGELLLATSASRTVLSSTSVICGNHPATDANNKDDTGAVAAAAADGGDDSRDDACSPLPPLCQPRKLAASLVRPRFPLVRPFQRADPDLTLLLERGGYFVLLCAMGAVEATAHRQCVTALNTARAWLYAEIERRKESLWAGPHAVTTSGGASNMVVTDVLLQPSPSVGALTAATATATGAGAARGAPVGSRLTPTFSPSGVGGGGATTITISGGQGGSQRSGGVTFYASSIMSAASAYAPDGMLPQLSAGGHGAPRHLSLPSVYFYDAVYAPRSSGDTTGENQKGGGDSSHNDPKHRNGSACFQADGAHTAGRVSAAPQQLWHNTEELCDDRRDDFSLLQEYIIAPILEQDERQLPVREGELFLACVRLPQRTTAVLRRLLPTELPPPVAQTALATSTTPPAAPTSMTTGATSAVNATAAATSHSSSTPFNTTLTAGKTSPSVASDRLPSVFPTSESAEGSPPLTGDDTEQYVASPSGRVPSAAPTTASGPDGFPDAGAAVALSESQPSSFNSTLRTDAAAAADKEKDAEEAVDPDLTPVASVSAIKEFLTDQILRLM